jgi:outer membrane receptor for ferrienterochelin and colicins
VLGNPELDPERSRTVDAAVEWDPVAALGLSLSGWWTRLDDLIDITGTGDPATGGAEFVYTNVEEARTRGVEATLALTPADHLDLDLSYTFTDAWNLTVDRPLSGRARHRGTIDFDWTVPVTGTRVSVRAAIVGERPFFLDEQIGIFGPPQEEPTIAQPYALVDPRLEQRIVDGLEIFAGVDNLFDAGEPDLLPIPPRLFYVGIDAHLRGRTKEPTP